MGYILKEGKTYTDPQYGDARTTAYALVNVINIEYNKCTANIVLSIYPSKDLCIAQKQPLEVCSKICKNWIDKSDPENPVTRNDFDTYVVPTIVGDGANAKDLAYEFWEKGGITPNIGGFFIINWTRDDK